MKNLLAPHLPLALVVLAVAAVAARIAARRPAVPGTGPAPVPVPPGRGQARAAVTTGRRDGTAADLARPPAPPARPAGAVDQARHIFHELHADGRHSSCAVCDTRYRAA